MPRKPSTHRKDANHDAIVTALEQAGALVFSLTSQGSGCPDLLVRAASGRLLLLEVKVGKGGLTDDQQSFVRRGWPVQIVRDPESAMAAVRGAT